MNRLVADLGLLGLLGASLAACAGSAKEAARTPPEQAEPLPPGSDEPNDDEASEPTSPPSGRAWAERTWSPQPGSAPEPELDDLLVDCGAGDAALHDVAAWVAEFDAEHDGPPSLDAINFELKRRGSPYVMPRLWAATASGPAAAELPALVKKWSQGRKARGQLRCGAGVATRGGAEHYAVLQVDVSAELSPTPTRLDSGAFLDVEATFLVPTTSASFVLLPPEGAPRTLDTRVESGRARARLSLPTDGTWFVQLMATQEGGPLPVASALITTGAPRPDALDARPVPGEKAFDPHAERGDALFTLVNAARKDQGLPALRRNSQLDRAAREHTQRMLAQGRIAHDAGDGDPASRVAALGLSPKATGENVALAQSVPRLHRALWASPSHRENLLMRRWDQVGISVLERDDGTLFCTQLFIDAE